MSYFNKQTSTLRKNTTYFNSIEPTFSHSLKLTFDFSFFKINSSGFFEKKWTIK